MEIFLFYDALQWIIPFLFYICKEAHERIVATSESKFSIYETDSFEYILYRLWLIPMEYSIDTFTDINVNFVNVESWIKN